MIRALAPGLLLGLTLAPALVTAQPSPELRQAILAYRLTLPLAEKLLAALPEMTRYVMAKPNASELIARARTQSLAERIAQVEADPGAMAILRKHGLGAREYVVGVPALRMALGRAASGEGEGGGLVVVSPENLAFARAHLTELKPKLDAADRGTAPR